MANAGCPLGSSIAYVGRRVAVALGLALGATRLRSGFLKAQYEQSHCRRVPAKLAPLLCPGTI